MHGGTFRLLAHDCDRRGLNGRGDAVVWFSILALGKSHKANACGKDKQEGEHKQDQF